MVNKYYKKKKQRKALKRKKKHMKGTKIFLKNKKTKSANMLGKDIKNLPNKKKRKDITIIRNISKSYLSIEEVIIYLFITCELL